MAPTVTPTVSVIIPTLGRPTLKKVISEILRDSVDLEIEIILVADGVEAFSKIELQNLSGKEIRIVSNARSKGISGALNTGLESATGDFLMFFSDDDTWLNGKLKNALKLVNPNQRTCVCLQTESVNQRGRNIIRPSKVPKVVINPVNYCYGSSPFVHNDRYISLTSFIAPQSVKEIKFSEELNSREDIAWLQSLFRNGFDIKIEPFVGAFVEIGYERTVKRDSVEELKSWMKWMRDNSPENLSCFLFSHYLRPFAISGRIFHGISTLMKVKFWSYRPTLRSILSFLFTILAGMGVVIRITKFSNLFKRVTFLKHLV